MTHKVNLLRANPTHIDELRSLCVNLYSNYFADHWENNGLQKYLDDQFGHNVMIADLNNESIHYYIIQQETKSVGFMKVNINSTLAGVSLSCCELEKMYIAEESKGKGIGKKALNLLCTKMSEYQKKMIFLDVIATNDSAISFYNNYGFKYHSTIKLQLEGFKEHLNKLNLMFMKL